MHNSRVASHGPASATLKEGADSRLDGIQIGGIDRIVDGQIEYVVWRPPFGERVTAIRDAILGEVMHDYGDEVGIAAKGLSKSPPVEPGPPPLAETLVGATSGGVFYRGVLCDYRVVWPARDGTECARWLRLQVTGHNRYDINIHINGIQEIPIVNKVLGQTCAGFGLAQTCAEPVAMCKLSAMGLDLEADHSHST